MKALTEILENFEKDLVNSLKMSIFVYIKTL